MRPTAERETVEALREVPAHEFGFEVSLCLLKAGVPREERLQTARCDARGVTRRYGAHVRYRQSMVYHTHGLERPTDGGMPMLDSLALEKTIRGTWKDVLAHRDEISETSEVEVRILNPKPNDEETESRRLLDLLESVLGEIDPTLIEPATEPPSPYQAAVIEKYRRQGWQV